MGEYAVGLDIGGTKMAAGLVEFPSGEVRERRVRRTEPSRGGGAVLDDALDLASSLATRGATDSDAPVCGIGVGVAELVDLVGNVTSSHTIPWQGMDVQEHFASLVPVAVVDSDVRTAALGEALFGAGRSHDVFGYVSVGTGISACLVVGGRPYAGAHGNAVVLATGRYGLECQHCGEWAEGALEEYAAGPALARRYGGDATSAEQVFAAAAEDDPRALEVVTSGGRALGHAIGLLINIWDPSAVVVGGGLGLAGGTYWTSMLLGIRHTVWPAQRLDCPVTPARLAGDAGVIGAAATAWQRSRGDIRQDDSIDGVRSDDRPAAVYGVGQPTT